MTLLDTHAWLWWLSDPAQLSEAAQAQIAVAIQEGRLGSSSISAWEAQTLVKTGRLELTLSVDSLVAHSESLPFFTFLPLSAHIAVNAARLEPFHPDPADRIIVATTVHFGGELITKDERIRRFEGVRTAW